MIETLKIKLFGTQPAAKISSEQIDKLIRREFNDSYDEVRLKLSRIRSDNQNGKNRISAAILKLANGDLDKIDYLVNMAIDDFRDIVSKAEYPRNSKHGFDSIDKKTSKREYLADWKDYSSWIKRERKENKMSLEESFNQWMSKLNQTENVDSEITAFNFGLFETADGYSIYLIGSKNYDLSDDDWATNVDFEPKDKYLHFDIDLVIDKDWEEILKISVDLIEKYVISDDFKNSILKNATAITTGFDDGDLHRVK
jgi:predicted nucleotidyltransferase